MPVSSINELVSIKRQVECLAQSEDLINSGDFYNLNICSLIGIMTFEVYYSLTWACNSMGCLILLSHLVCSGCPSQAS